MKNYKNQKIMDDIQKEFGKYEAKLAIEVLKLVEDKTKSHSSVEFSKIVNAIYEERESDGK